MKDATDAGLMLVAKTNSDRAAEAFGEIARRYGGVLLNFFMRKGVSYDDGQDLAQRTLVRLWRYRDRYEPRAKLTTFMFMAAGQEAIDFFRSEDRRRRLEKGLENEMESEPRRIGGSAADGRGEEVRAAVARLPPAMRDVVELGVFQDLPYAEVAGILGIPEGTVKSRMHNAVRKLKEELDEHRP